MTAAGDLDKARVLLSRLRADMPLNIPLHLAEVDLYLRAKQLDSANALIDEALDQSRQLSTHGKESRYYDCHGST